MEKLMELLKKLLATVSQLRSDLLYTYAYKALGTDASPHDDAPDEYGCVDSVTQIIKKVIPAFPTFISTIEFYAFLSKSPLLRKINSPKKGCIILSVTGTGNGRVKNGHAAIVGKNLSPDKSLWIMSNDSRTGMWTVNYTVNSWDAFYRQKGGMEIHYFELV